METKKLRFLHASSEPPPSPTEWTVWRDTWRRVKNVLIVFAGVTLGCALIYRLGVSSGGGIVATFSTNASPADVWDCLYFSVVTIATLGYGDFRPVGLGRIVASVEVVAGIVLMGVFVSRLVSRQGDRMALRLISGQLNSEIQRFRGQIQLLKSESKPGLYPLNISNPSDFLNRASGLASAIARYWRHEGKEPDLGFFLPVRAAGRLAGDLIELLGFVKILASGLQRKDLHREDYKAIRRLTESSLLVVTVLAERAFDKGLNHSYDRVSTLVRGMRIQLRLRRFGC